MFLARCLLLQSAGFGRSAPLTEGRGFVTTRGQRRMKRRMCWLLAEALLLLLGVTGVVGERLQAENLILLPPDAHDVVLNRGMRGAYQSSSLCWFYLNSLVPIIRPESLETLAGNGGSGCETIQRLLLEFASPLSQIISVWILLWVKFQPVEFLSD